MPCPGDGGEPFEKTPIVIAVSLHATIGVGLVGSLQPVSIAAATAKMEIRTSIAPLVFENATEMKTSQREPLPQSSK